MSTARTTGAAASHAGTKRVQGDMYVRAAVGILLAAHGAHGLFGWLGDYDFATPGYSLDPWPDLSRTFALLADGIEFGCGVLLAFGHATRAMAALALAMILGALLLTPFGVAPSGTGGAALLSVLLLFDLARGAGPTSSRAAQRPMAVHVQDIHRLVARVTASPWFRARLPATSAFARRRVAARASSKRRIPCKSTQRRVT